MYIYIYSCLLRFCFLKCTNHSVKIKIKVLKIIEKSLIDAQTVVFKCQFLLDTKKQACNK